MVSCILLGYLCFVILVFLTHLSFFNYLSGHGILCTISSRLSTFQSTSLSRVPVLYSAQVAPLSSPADSFIFCFSPPSYHFCVVAVITQSGFLPRHFFFCYGLPHHIFLLIIIKLSFIELVTSVCVLGLIPLINLTI